MPTPTPGTTVTGQVVQQTGGAVLVIMGTDGADTITLTQTATGMTLTTQFGTSTFDGTFAGVALYGFGGNDTIHIAYSVTAAATVYGGTGNDSIFDAGQGAGTLYAGSGNCLLVSIGGGADKVYGGSGTDSFWVDSGDTLYNVTSAETAAGNVHTVGQFFVPSTNGSGPVPLDINGQALADPLTGYGYANLSACPLFVDGPQYNDISQGNMGDCYFMASLASMAQQNPNVIRQLVTSLGDGTYAVRFYRNNQAVYVRVDGDLPVYSGSSLAYAHYSPTGEIWAPLVEKAYAEFRCNDNNYDSLNGGWMGCRLRRHHQPRLHRHLALQYQCLVPGQPHQQRAGRRTLRDGRHARQHLEPVRRRPCLHGQGHRDRLRHHLRHGLQPVGRRRRQLRLELRRRTPQGHPGPVPGRLHDHGDLGGVISVRHGGPHGGHARSAWAGRAASSRRLQVSSSKLQVSRATGCLPTRD